MKESKLIQMEKNVQVLGTIADRMIGELENLKTLTMGLHTTMKKMPGYDEAIKQLKEEVQNGQEQGDT